MYWMKEQIKIKIPPHWVVGQACCGAGRGVGVPSLLPAPDGCHGAGGGAVVKRETRSPDGWLRVAQYWLW